MLSRQRAAVLPLLIFATCATAPTSEAPVRALRYRQFICESGMEFIHGGGRWMDCLFLPDAGVVCTIAFEWRPTVDNAFPPDVPCVYARRSTLAAELGKRPKESPLATQAPEEIEVSAAFARDAIRIADLTEQQRALADDLGARCVSASFVRPPLDRDF